MQQRKLQRRLQYPDFPKEIRPFRFLSRAPQNSTTTVVNETRCKSQDFGGFSVFYCTKTKEPAPTLSSVRRRFMSLQLLGRCAVCACRLKGATPKKLFSLQMTALLQHKGEHRIKRCANDHCRNKSDVGTRKNARFRTRRQQETHRMGNVGI